MMKKILSEKFRFLLWSLTLFSFFCIESSYAQLARKSSATSVNGAEISAFDPATNRLFTVAGNAIEYYTLNSAGTLSSPTSIPYGFTVAVGSTAIPNSVAVKNGVLVFGFAVVGASNVQQPGKVAFYNPTTATYISDVTVGYLPDMIAFSPDGTKILTANEGEPNSYGVVGTSFDPEGSVSIIDIAAGIASATVTEASFTSFNSQMATLKAAGVRIYGPNATVAQDLEPEYVTFIDNATAAVTLQENNAVAMVDIATGIVTNIYPLGLKDHSIAGNGFDASDRDLTSTTGKINIQNWPVKGMYMPDAITSFTSGGSTYFITANEGDSRDYTGFTEEIRVGATGATVYTLDPTVFPTATATNLKLNANLGRLQLTKATGDTDGDGDFDEIHALGARSFTIWNSTFTPVFDSGDQLEQITATQSAASFNSDGTSSSFDGRSDNKGPEPEGVTTGTVNGVLYAFVGSERTGDVFMYDITNPTAPVFKQYINTAADTGVEGIIFVPASNSPTGNALVITSAELSKTVSVYEFTPPTVNVTAGTIVCTGATTMVTVSATAGTAPYTGTGTFTVGAGTYSYTVTDANGLTTTASVTISQPATALVASSASQATVNCNSTTATVVVAATGGTAPYTGTGTFTVGAGSYSYTVTDANGCTAVTTGTVTNVADTTNPTIYLQPSALLTGATGPSTTQTPYLQSQSIGGKYTSILSVNDAVGGYKMVGIPDGLGAYDNNNGTFTLLMNHELGNTAGITRAHGSAGAFVSKWVINKSDLAVQSGSDLIQTVNTWNTTSNSFVSGTTIFNRFCSADLPSVPALYNAASGLGTQERIFLTGEESGAEGRAFGHIATGATAGVSYELPYLGKFSWENVVASPATGNKTVVAGTDDATTNGQVYFYVGTKTNTGTEIDKAGLNNGKLFGVNVTGLASESTSSIPAANTAFTLSDLGFVQNKTGATLNTESVTAGATNFLRPEDGGFDPSNPNDFYFVTTNGFTAPSRMWRLRFTDIANPETGGTITAVLDGTEGQKMLDNMTIDKLGHILLQEDPGGQAHNAKMWQYTIATDALELVGKHDAARFGEVVGSTTTAATLPYNNDEESSGVIDMSDILGPGMFLIDDQAHYTTGLANLTEVVQGGQLLAFFNPASVSATVSTAAPATITACSGTGIVLGTPATADNCSIASLTNNAPTTFPVGTTTVTWTATDASGNTAIATQTVIVTAVPNAGTNGLVTVCTGTKPSEAQLFEALTGEDTGGTWTNSGLVYTYTVNATAPCTVNATSTVTVTEQALPNAGTSGTLSVTIGTTPTNAQLFAGLNGYPTVGGTWTNSGLVYTYTVAAIAPCTLAATATVTVSESIPTALIFCAGAKVSDAVGATTLKFYTAQTGTAAPLASTVALTTKTYYATQGTTVSPRVAVAITVNALPVTPSALKLYNKNVNYATPDTAIPAVGLYVGADVNLELTATAVDATSYEWTLPAGVTLSDGTTTGTVTSTENTILVKFSASDATTSLVVSVKSINASGCISAAKTLTLTRAASVAPANLKMNNGLNTTAITTFAKYMGTHTVLRLTAAVSATATSYVWDLPTGVTRVTGLNDLKDIASTESTLPEIFVTLKGVDNLNTFNYSTTATVPVSTNVLRIGVYGKNGTGVSTTVNEKLANPATTSTARLLTLTAVKPAASATLKMYDLAVSATTAVSAITTYLTTEKELKLEAKASALASSYTWVLSEGVNVTNGSADAVQGLSNNYTSTSNAITVNFANVPHEGAFSLVLGVKAVNGMGESVSTNAAPNASRTDKLLTLTAALPSVPGAVTGSLRICATTVSSVTYTIATVAKNARDYFIEVPEGCTITSLYPDGNVVTSTGIFSGTPAVANAYFTVNYPAGFVVTSANPKTITIKSANYVGESATNRVLILTNVNATCHANPRFSGASVANEFSAKAYPNPSSSEFTIETSAKGAINAKVYDMQGRLVENANTTKVGSSLAPGIYNVIVSQGANTKSVRVIKK